VKGESVAAKTVDFEPEQNSPTARLPVSSSSAPAPKFWLTTSSNKRHNSSCRYFEKSRGRFCGPTEGIPCKLCGG
jgi:hypothetical protein